MTREREGDVENDFRQAGSSLLRQSVKNDVGFDCRMTRPLGSDKVRYALLSVFTRSNSPICGNAQKVRRGLYI